MKHEVTSYNTRKLLSLTLKNIMKEKELSKISISEVAEMAHLNRKTFYYHFKDIHNLLTWTLEDEAAGLIKKVGLATSGKEVVDIMLDYLEKNYDFVDNIINSSAHLEVREFLYISMRDSLLKTIEESCEKKHIELEEAYKMFVAGFCTEAFNGMILHWLKNKNRISREKLQEYLDRIFNVSIENLLVEATKV
ncbi:MAG: TetR/AcrR family transcriptional regulator C-terminal domain-containing protein [Candidatus Saccharibacteria bacterium]|nr:TetR/AcrR family transcriptional regulator C-terminal domain-containing protein [Candidatus Saccharibacteria bacterium]